MTPVLPSEFESCLPEANDKLWQIIVKTFIKFPVLWWRWVRYAYNADGTFTTAFKKELCDAITACREDDTTTSV